MIFGEHGVVELLNTKKELQALQQRVSKLKAERDRLHEEIEYYQQEPLAVEEIARRDLWLMKKNEKVVVIIPQNNYK